MMAWYVYGIDTLWLYVDETSFYKHMSWNPETPYNDLPIPPPDLERVETRNVLNACISARAAIAKLKTVSELILSEGTDKHSPDAGNERFFTHWEHHNDQRSALSICWPRKWCRSSHERSTALSYGALWRLYPPWGISALWKHRDNYLNQITRSANRYQENARNSIARSE